MNILVCIKRVPATGGKMTLTADGQDIDTRHLGWTISPHEECAVEAALRLAETAGGATAVLTLGPAEAAEQLRDALAMGIERALLLESDGGEWDAGATAAAIAQAVRAEPEAFDVLLFGSDSADAGGYQVGVRVAHLLGLPCVTGVKSLAIENGKFVARREAGGGWEVFEAELPAVLTVKEGINLPRYPSMPGRIKAKKKPIQTSRPERRTAGLVKTRLRLPPTEESQTEILGKGPEAVPQAVALLKKLGVLAQ